jgi:hypothetical protein
LTGRIGGKDWVQQKRLELEHHLPRVSSRADDRRLTTRRGHSPRFNNLLDLVRGATSSSDYEIS